MNNLMKVVYVLLFIVALIASPLRKEFPAAASGVWYVSPTGDDEHGCLSPASPCGTINGAIAKAASGDTIKAAVGTYTSTGREVILIDKDINLTGGWDTNFISQTGSSTIDGQNARQGIWIESNINATIERFTIENGSSQGGIGIINQGVTNLAYSIVENNLGGGGILNQGTMMIQWSTVRNNTNLYNNNGRGGGIYNSQNGGPLTITNSTISGNYSALGGGIYSAGQDISIVNSTVSGNTTISKGGGIYITGSSDHTYTIENSTIAGNEGGSFEGGGIYFTNSYGGNIILKDTLVADNKANIAPDCYGSIASSGYNIIGNTTGCSFSSAPGDQLGVDPLLGPLQDNGGPTFTQWLYAGSPAIDGGDPSGCSDYLGNPLLVDQRGYERPLDGAQDGNAICDIGAYEADPDNLPPPPPESLWYVSPTGKDDNDCHTPVTPCATINGAIQKAQSGDNVYVSADLYTADAGSEVVLVDKSLNLYGGWNADFTAQNSLTTVDGQHDRRGITIGEQITVRIDYFNVQNGLAPFIDYFQNGGGGLDIGYRSNVTLSDSIVQGNIAGKDSNVDPSSPYGGGICMHDYGSLTLNDSWVLNNQAYEDGGGIFNDVSMLTLNHSVISKNSAKSDGGGIATWADIVVNDSLISDNHTLDEYGRGGGIFSNDGMVTLNQSFLRGNIANGSGGGVDGSTIVIKESTLSGNIARSGGGIKTVGEVTISDSTLTQNHALFYGGAIYNGNHVYLTNSSILYNHSDQDGGGIYEGVIEASNVTIAGNTALSSGGGIFSYSTLTLRNTILSGNQAPAGPDCSGTLTSAGNILVGDTAGCAVNGHTGDLLNVDPRFIRPFGSPAYLPFWEDSPALDAGNPNGCVDHLNNPVTTDQGGALRPIDGNSDGNALCDIGAYEYDPAHLPHWTFLPFIVR